MFKPMLAMLASRSERRYLLEWVRSWQPNYLLQRPLPWLSYAAIEYMEKYLPPHAFVFEYGSGGSTLYWLRRGAACVSIEHDPAWYNMIRPLLPVGTPIDYRLVQPEQVDARFVGDPADPYAYQSADPNLQRFSFQDYVSQVDDFADESFDLLLVDGRARPACIRHGVKKVRLGGWLVLDNADRDYYLAQTHSFLHAFAMHVFVGSVPANEAIGRTDVYIRIQ